MNLQKGDFFTVVEWTQRKDNSYKGAVLELKLIDGEFIRAKNHTGYYGINNITLDTRQVELRKLSREYVEDCVPSLRNNNPFRAVAVS